MLSFTSTGMQQQMFEPGTHKKGARIVNEDLVDLGIVVVSVCFHCVRLL